MSILRKIVRTSKVSKTSLKNRAFLLFTCREMMILFAVLMFVASIPMVLEQMFILWEHWSTPPTDKMIDDMENLIDGFAGVMVAAGVYMEEREAIREIALGEPENIPLQHYLNEVSLHNGMGILMMGLFMEVGTLVLEMPERLVNTDGIEKHIFGICLTLSVLSLIILLDFVIDYVSTYFKKHV